MKKAPILLAVVFVFLAKAKSQSTTELKSIKLVEQRMIELNGGLRSSFGGKSRTFIKIDLPANTREWYYSFTTATGASGTANLNLALQLSTLLVDPSGLSAMALKKIKVPAGTSSSDIYLCDRQNIDLFEAKADLNGSSFRYILEGSVMNTTQALVKIDDVKQGTWYIGLKNPSSLDATNIVIEVVAIVEEKKIIQKTAEQEKAELFGTMGWKAYERGEYDKCLELSNEAIKLNPELGWVHNNIGLVKLVRDNLIEAIDSYSKAVAIFKKSENPKQWLAASIKDLNDLINKKNDLQGAKDILETIKTEYNKY